MNIGAILTVFAVLVVGTSSVLFLRPSTGSPDWYSAAVSADDAGRYAEALELLYPEVEDENPTAQNFLGIMYLHGRGVVQDYAFDRQEMMTKN